MSGLNPSPRKSLLGRHRLLSPTAGVFVPPICLGAMKLGSAMKTMLRECNKETSFFILDNCYSQGDSFIDTANRYQAEESETWIGEWLAKTGLRDVTVLATQYVRPYKDRSEFGLAQSNFGVNGTKSLHLSVKAHLKKLQKSIFIVCACIMGSDNYCA
jgi:aryl-alcohol dehydrogenase-like predicted oxidoreductase